MSLLSLTLPALKRGESPITFTNTSTPVDEDALSWVTSAPVEPCGLVFCQRTALLIRLQREEARRREVHADPTLMDKLWGKAAQEGEDDAQSDGLGEDAEEEHQQTYARKKKFVKLSDEDLLVDWYDVLKLEQAEGATEDQIRAAYRRRCLETHPDKQKDHSDELFKKVQRAFDILGDPDARQTFDCSRPFDDEIPGEVVEEGDFFATFAPVFERNKKWSTEKGMPSLGTEKTSYKDVMRFYDRWSQFHTWRDFSHLVDLEEIDDSMCREEKRYYMRENERQLNQFRREELKRVRTLVERARKNDPRLRRKREQDEAKRLKEVEEREAFRRRIREEDERRRAEAEEAERAKKEAERKAIQESKNAMRQAQKDLLDFLQSNGLLDETATNKLLSNAVRRQNVVWLFSKLSTPEEAKEVVGTISAASTARAPRSAANHTDDSEKEEVEAALVFNRLVEEREKQVGFTRYGEPVKKVKTEEEKARAGASGASPKTATVEWTEDDLSRLQKAVAKYPPGTVERWSKIVVQLRHRFTEEQAMMKVNELTAALHSGGPAGASHGASMAGGAGATAGATASATVSTGSPASPPTTPAVEDWTVKQQKQLEQGLRELKDYKEKDKFQKIAKMVEGKTAKECFDRFKFLCSVNKKK